MWRGSLCAVRGRGLCASGRCHGGARYAPPGVGVLGLPGPAATARPAWRWSGRGCRCCAATGTTRPSRAAGAADHDALADLPGVKLRLAKMRPGRREGVEGEIHRDLTTLARNKAVSDAMVVSGEEDLAQVIADVQDMGMRVTLLHIATDGNAEIPRALRQECDDIVEISAAQLRPVRRADLRGGAAARRRKGRRDARAARGRERQRPRARERSRERPCACSDAAPSMRRTGREEDRADARPGARRDPAAAYDTVADYGTVSDYRPLDDYRAGQDYGPPLPDCSPSLPDYGATAPGSTGPPCPTSRPRAGLPGGRSSRPAPRRLRARTAQLRPGAAGTARAGRAVRGAGRRSARRRGPGRRARAGPAASGAGPAPPGRVRDTARAPFGTSSSSRCRQPRARRGGRGLTGTSRCRCPSPRRRRPVRRQPRSAGCPATTAAHRPAATGQPSQPSRCRCGPADPVRGPLGHAGAVAVNAGARRSRRPDLGPGRRPGPGSGGQPIAPVVPMEQAGHGSAVTAWPPPTVARARSTGRSGSSGRPGTSTGPRPGRQPGLQSGRPAGPGDGAPGQQGRPGQAGQPGPDAYPGAEPGNRAASGRAQDAGGSPGYSGGQSGVSLADAVQSAHEEGQAFGESVARDAPALWLEAVLARKPRMPSDLEARLLQGSALPIDFLLHDEVRHALRRGFWDALEHARR